MKKDTPKKYLPSVEHCAAPAEVAQRLCDWQLQYGRHDLPWMVAEAYPRWVSEILLQQTQVSTVRDYYDRFMERFPTIEILAQAPLEDVLALWSGLGYYSRARNMHKTAQRVVNEFGGIFPTDPKVLETLPGIGRSTAGALASFVANIPAPVLDGNVKRVLSRLDALDFPVDKGPGLAYLWERVTHIIEACDRPSVFNQATMDMGAMICTKNQPKCLVCPLAHLCQAYQTQSVLKFPIKSPKPVRTNLTMTLVCVMKDDHLGMVMRPGKGIWAHLMCLPEVIVPEGQFLPGKYIWTRVHVLTHRNLTLHIVAMTPEQLIEVSDTLVQPMAAMEWLTLEEALNAGIPAPIRQWLGAVEVSAGMSPRLMSSR